MNCPFCAEHIKDEAAVCRHCGRDLSITKAVYAELRAAFDQIAQLNARIGQLEKGLPPPSQHATRDTAPMAVASWGRSFLIAFSLLVLAHGVVMIGLDLESRPWIFRLIVMALSLALAFTDAETPRRNWASIVVFAAVLGLFAVLGMDSLNWMKTGTPIFIYFMPYATASQIQGDIAMQLSYMASIALSYITGALLLRFAGPRDAIQRQGPGSYLAARIAATWSKAANHIEIHEARVHTTAIYVEALIIFGSAGGALVTGLAHIGGFK